ncbi:hypothetical protein [Enterobacter asburiae]|uniref:hypothetical protein n=1 Tax=Enterobacter asburiae TaxID=61645 RepID=UPI00200407D8|nr:hypothetical protein [Enterobacter asburiae]MCK7419817.1 hypothetical protein [Enterobacter asburiae]
MIYSVKTYYVNSNTDARLIRYDVIKLNDDTYQVKVFDDQQRGISDPSLVVQIDDFQITREEYNKKYPSGFQTGVAINTPPGFENTITDSLQIHRDSIK